MFEEMVIMDTTKIKEEYADAELLREMLVKLSDQQIMGIIMDLGVENPVSLKLQKRLRTLKEVTHKNANNSCFQDSNVNTGSAQMNINNEQPGLFDAIVQFADRAHMTDPEVYNSARMNRALWYRMRDNKDAKPRKRNILKIALVLRLNYWELNYLVNLGGFSFLPRHDKTDSIVAQCAWNNIYEPEAIDDLLYERGEETLFSEL
jgi:hypothetical protein